MQIAEHKKQHENNIWCIHIFQSVTE